MLSITPLKIISNIVTDKKIMKDYSRYLELYQVDELKELFDKYGWEASDDIVVEMAGTRRKQAMDEVLE